MADDAPSTTTTQSNDGNSLVNFAIGMSLLDALGNSGEVVGRRNSLFFNNTYDAFGFPRNQFSLIQNLMPQQQGMGLWGGDLRDVLGNNAEVYGRSDSAFSFAMMNMLAGGGIFGLLLGLAAINAQAEHDRQRQAGAAGPSTGTTGAAIGNASGTTSTAGQYTDELGTVTIPGENGATPVIVPASGPTLPVGGAVSSVEANTVSRQIVVPAGVAAPAGAVCEEPKEDTAISRTCSVTRPKGPGM